MSGFQIRVNATPAGQGSKRHVGHGVMVEDAGDRLVSWREAIRSEAQGVLEAGAEPILAGPIGVKARIIMPRPKRHFRTGKHAGELRADAPYWCDTTPDVDKVTRSILDALTDAGVWRDDRQVAWPDIRQVYAAPGEAPGALITITPLSEATG